MSGDVQPRKRKDKRRKKEDLIGPEEVPIPTVAAPPPPVNEDFNIHVHNDHGTGGGLCAKLVFFILLSALAIVIGSVITQNRGLTDLDTPASESRFANIFSGWIDDSINSHDDNHHGGVDFEDKHGDAHEHDDEHQLSNEEHHESGEDAHGSEEDAHGSEEDAHGSEEDAHGSEEDAHGSEEDAHESEEENHVSEEDEEEGEKDDVDDDQQVSEEEYQKNDDDDDDDDDNDEEEQLSEQDQEATEEDVKQGNDEYQISDEEHNDEEDNNDVQQDEDNDDEQQDEDNDDEQHDEDNDEQHDEDNDDDVQQDDEQHADDTAEQLDDDDDQQNEENQVDEQDQGTNESNENDDAEDNDIAADNGSNEETDGRKDDQNEIENDESNEDNNVDNDVMDELENTSEAPSNVDNTPEESTQEDTFTSKEQEIVEEDSAETNIEDFGEEEVTDNTAGVEELEKEEVVPEVEEDNSSVAVKFGVGVALVVVAHIVLVRKWRSGKQNANKSAEDEVNAEMSRRNTIIPVSTPDQLEQEIQNAEDEYSEEDEEELEEESEEEIITPTHKYMQFRTDYSSPSSAEDIVKQRIESVQSAEPNVKYYYKKTDDVKQTDNNDDEPEEEEEELEEDNNEEVDEGDGETGNVEIEGDDVEEESHEEMETGGDDVKSDEDVEGDDAEEEESEEEISDVDDDELLKKLEARYGKLSNKRFNNADDHDHDYDDVDVEDKYDSKKSDKMINIASLSKEKNVLKTDDKLREKLKNAENSLIDNVELALSLYTNLMEKLPNNAEVKYGRARALDKLAEIKRNNVLLQNAISSYYDLLQNSTISDVIFAFVGTRCIDLIRFSGVYSRAIYAHKKLIDRFPNDSKYLNELAVTLLTSNRLAEAKRVLQKVLARWPDNGFAQVHYGFILKVKENDLSGAIKYLQAGIKTKAPGVIDGRFYFHLGDALTRLGQRKEAIKVYEDGVGHKVFLSKYQRSLYNVNRLTAKPWWSASGTAYSRFFHILKENWKIIRDEGVALLNEEKYFIDETEDLRDTGKWAQFELFARGFKLLNNCKKCPETCKIIESFPDARDCKRGQVKFSVMHPGTHVWPHCGPTNSRLRAHLGLMVPSGTYIRVAEEIRYWKEGEVILFDDSFEHEVWHNGSDIRLILIIDVWHPELTDSEKRSLLPI